MDNTPRLELLKKLYDRLFTSGTALSRLKDAIISERLYPGPTDSLDVAGRSLAWKLFLSKEEPLHASLPPRASSLLESLRDSRRRFAALLEEKSQAPDTKPGTIKNPRSVPQRISKGIGNLDFNNPLSLHDENPWNEWFAGLELRKVISQDVERTFPDISFFREIEVQDQLTNILFLYSAMNPSIGYRQGMHELLAPLYFAVHFDAIDEGEMRDEQYTNLSELCSIHFAAADAWALFHFVMQGVSKSYEWREPLEDASSPFPNLAIIPEGHNGIRPYIAPIVQACNHIQSNLLRACDPILFQHMQKAGIEPQIYGIRWLRLLFTREFNMSDAMKLWDCLFACDATLDIAQWVCVAMLIRIRNDLIPADYSGQLTILLRYPSPSSSNKVEGAPHHSILFLRQALALQLAPNAATGATIVMENRTLLNIPLEVPASPAPSPIKRGRPNRPPSMSFPNHPEVGRHHSRQASSPAANLSEMFTRGLVERGESLGINKTLMNAVTEIRRNIPELAASLGVRTPNQTPTSFPLVEEKPFGERPPWEPRTRFEMEGDLSLLRSRDKSLGESLAWIVDALLQDESEVRDAERIKLQKREALESLSYVRDVMMTNSMDLDADRLIGGEEKLRRKTRAKKESENMQAASAAVMLNPPAPVADSHLKSLGTQRIRPRSPPGQLPTTSRAPSHVPNVNADITRKAPWNYTRSSFAHPTPAVPSTMLPRPPPPTSTSLRREAKKSTDQTPTRNDESLDPLGALR